MAEHFARAGYTQYMYAHAILHMPCHVIAGGGASHACARARLRAATLLCNIIWQWHYDM